MVSQVFNAEKRVNNENPWTIYYTNEAVVIDATKSIFNTNGSHTNNMQTTIFVSKDNYSIFNM
jgi:hypothetical protein